MNVGFVGLGKLGLPVALATEAAGHIVRGFDVSTDVTRYIQQRELPYKEQGAEELLAKTKIQFMRPNHLADWADIVFVAVQTPHQPEYEGVTPLPESRADFDYTHLQEAVASVSNAKVVVVISTVLPGTMEQHIFPIVGPGRLLYNPFFIAMGTTIPDFRDPEFVLIGTDACHPSPLAYFYKRIHTRPLFITTVKTAELTKVAYNTFIGMKIAFANTMMELCEKTGADIDDLTDALGLADRRLISTAYMRGGMGDGGGCHPRDNIALSWLARKHNLSYDLFSALMECREKQTEWIGRLAAEEEKPIEILGQAYKPETNLTVGSPALLLGNLLRRWGFGYMHTDPYV